MSTRKEKIQLEVEINGQRGGSSLKELKLEATALNRELNLLTPGTEKFIKKSKRLKQVNDQLATVREQTRGVAQGLDDMKNKSSGLIGAFKNLLPALGPAAIVAGVVGIGKAVAGVVSESLKLFNVQAKADAQLRATLRSTNNAAGRTFEQLKEQASALQGQTLFGDEVTQQAQALLLTFTQVKEEVFDDSIPLIQDYATAMATASGETVDLKSASIQVGKALNDPIRGMSALAKSGVSFNESQKETVRTLQETGRIAEAQRIILAELESQFGGSARAAAEAGLGGYTQFQNKIGDVQESIGKLASNGLRQFLPFLNKGADFLQKFVDTAISGEAATGEFSGVINGLITGLKGLITPLNILYEVGLILFNNVFEPLGQFIAESLVQSFQQLRKDIDLFVEAARDIPIIGSIVQGVIEYFQIWSDLIEDTAATFTGFRAAAQQAVENVQSYFEGLVLSAQIAGQKLNLALSIRSETKDAIRADIQRLESLKSDAEQSGRTIGEAYAEARNRSIAEQNERAAKNEEEQVTAQAVTLANTIETNRKNQAAQRKEALALELKALENHFHREKLILDAKLLRNEVSEEDYHQRVHDATLSFYQDQLAAMDRYGEAASNKALEIQNKLLEAQQNTRNNLSAPERLDTLDLPQIQAPTGDSESKIANDEEAQLFRLRESFAQQIIAEEEYELQRLEVQRNAAQRRLELLQVSGEASVSQTRAAQTEVFDIEQQMSEQRLAIAEREKEVKAAVAQAQTDLAKSALDVGIQLLSQDEKARKKHAIAIKAFQIGQILANLPTEISGYYERYSTIPGGQIIAAAFSTLAGIRAALAVNKIRAQKFYRGGAVRSYTGEKVSGSPNAPTQPGGDNILAYLKSGEVVLNQQQQAALGGPATFRRIAVPGFNAGGIVESRITDVDTTPRGRFVSDLATSPADPGAGLSLSVLERIAIAAEQFPTNIRSSIAYEDILEKDNEMKQSQSESTL